MYVLQIQVTVAEVAAIAQKSVTETLAGQPWGPFTQLWHRIESELQRRADREKGEEGFPP